MTKKNKPDILKPSNFDEKKSEFLQRFFEHAASEVGEQQAQQMLDAIDSPNSVSALLVDTFILYRNADERDTNSDACQNFAGLATDSQMIDLVCKRLNVERQEWVPEDNTTYPPTPAVMESNDSLLLRYSIAPYSLATTGTRLGYKFHALTPNVKPLIEVVSLSSKQVQVIYTFPDGTPQSEIKDASARQMEPNTGKVMLTLLGHDGDGSVSKAQIDKVITYCKREDIAQETDELHGQSANIQRYTLSVDATEDPEPHKWIDRNALNAALVAYTKQQHRLEGEVLPSVIDQIFHNHGATSLVVNSPSIITCDDYSAPYCEAINVNVRTRKPTA